MKLSEYIIERPMLSEYTPDDLCELAHLIDPNQDKEALECLKQAIWQDIRLDYTLVEAISLSIKQKKSFLDTYCKLTNDPFRLTPEEICIIFKYLNLKENHYD